MTRHVDEWKEVVKDLDQASKGFQGVASKLRAAYFLVKATKDRKAPELDLLTEELDDVYSRFEHLRLSLRGQSGPVIEPAAGAMGSGDD